MRRVMLWDGHYFHLNSSSNQSALITRTQLSLGLYGYVPCHDDSEGATVLIGRVRGSEEYSSYVE